MALFDVAISDSTPESALDVAEVDTIPTLAAWHAASVAEAFDAAAAAAFDAAAAAAFDAAAAAAFDAAAAAIDAAVSPLSEDRS